MHPLGRQTTSLPFTALRQLIGPHAVLSFQSFVVTRRTLRESWTLVKRIGKLSFSACLRLVFCTYLDTLVLLLAP